MKNNYLIEYIDSFSLNNEINKIIKKEKYEDAIVNNYDLEESNLSNILENLDTYSFLADKEVIVVKNINLIDIDNTLGKHFLKYLDNPSENKLLIMASDKLDSRKKSTKEIKNKSNYIKLDNDPNTIIKTILNDYKLESGVINLLIEYTNSNIDLIKNECDKLIQYKYNEKEIKKDDVKTLCMRVLGDPTNITFDLVRYISSNDKKNSLITYKKLQEYNVDDIYIIGLLESQLRLLEQVCLFQDMGKNKTEISKLLDVHPYRVEKTMELLRYINKKEIDQLIIKLADLDYKYKSGLDLNKNPLELYLINI